MTEAVEQEPVNPDVSPEVQAEHQELVTQAEGYGNTAITNAEEYDSAINMHTIAKATHKGLEGARKSLSQPHYDKQQRINAIFNQMKSPVQAAIDRLGKAMLAYEAAEEKRVRQEEREREEQEREEREAEEALIEEKAAGLPPSGPPVAETPLPPAAPVRAAPAKTTRGTYGGKVTTRTTMEFEIIDVEKLPRVWMVPNEKMIRQAIAGGNRNIAGVRIFEKKSKVG